MALLSSILGLMQGVPSYESIAPEQTAAAWEIIRRNGGMTPPFNPDPAAMPEPPMAAAPMPGPAPSQPVPASAAPAQSKKRGGILGALESVFAPEAGSFWHSALANGLWDAKGGQQRYKNGAYDYGQASTKAQIDETKLRGMLREEQHGEIQMSPTGQVVRVRPDGNVDVLWTPPAPMSREEKLIDLWRRETDPQIKDYIMRAIPGYQYSPEYIEYKTEKQKDLKRTAPGKAPSTAAAPSAKLPTGFILD